MFMLVITNSLTNQQCQYFTLLLWTIKLDHFLPASLVFVNDTKFKSQLVSFFMTIGLRKPHDLKQGMKKGRVVSLRTHSERHIVVTYKISSLPSHHHHS